MVAVLFCLAFSVHAQEVLTNGIYFSVQGLSPSFLLGTIGYIHRFDDSVFIRESAGLGFTYFVAPPAMYRFSGSLSSDIHAMSAHVAVSGHPTLEQAQATGEQIKEMVATEFDIAHATIEMECEACPEPDPCALESPTAFAVLHPHRH